MNKIKIIGAGLAGAECAAYLSRRGYKVILYDIKPRSFTPAHKNTDYAELVCSNSLKSNDVFGNACGLLKQELRILNSLVMEAADKTGVPAGNALAVNRELFASYITEKLRYDENIECVCEEIEDIDQNDNIIIATGPLTTETLAENLKKYVGNRLSFYDASAPIISFDSIDTDAAFFGDRYGKGDRDHLNCPLDKEQYYAFTDELVRAKKAELHGFENSAVFEGCMPVEVMAERGRETLRYGPLKPTGLTNPKTGRWPYACLQLRKEDINGEMYNMVGFQTNLLWSEQKRVFSMIPALKNAEYIRYGVMHRNTFINSPFVLNKDCSLLDYPNIFFAGQITGVEGYVESAASGLVAGVGMARFLEKKNLLEWSAETVIGSLMKYITKHNSDFQPMNANFGILPPLKELIRDKKEKKKLLAERSISETEIIKENIYGRI